MIALQFSAQLEEPSTWPFGKRSPEGLLNLPTPFQSQSIFEMDEQFKWGLWTPFEATLWVELIYGDRLQDAHNNMNVWKELSRF
jgi:hypothetical protein